MIRTACLVFALLAAPALAEPMTRLDPARSRLEFSYVQMGVNMEGRFTRVGGRVAFDPAKPHAASAVLEIPVSGFDAGLDEANAEAAGKGWFDSKRFPVARFESTAVKALGGQRFRVDGLLTLKGQRRPVSAPFTFTPDAEGGQFSGQFVLRRGDFNIGDGAWRDTGIVANDITVRFNLRINR